ncbi:APL6 AP-3 complex subunit beta [Candida maltosa Xu316]|uniref:Clathrin/coatomer adaptor adaptin-like N-terminal domain-containing protein n=1 Tax=Candida maltosa (strain Xu316) TaxID=1245528 RepID=M3JTX5_CANMX|nr:hypothetical protein G210_3980 [Candida maltosa Xu316]
MSDSLSKITSMIESAKELTIEAAVSASSRLTDTPSKSRPQEISKLLNSRTDREVLNGMKCVMAIISKGEDGLPYFADVVKNITSTNAKVKQLVIVYLTKYADVEPDTALLSINSIQKSLNDKNPINRANAVRSLAGIRISSIVPILALSMKRTSTDPSGLVRAATAISIGKVYDLAGKSKKQMLEFLTKLMADSEALVVGEAIKSYCRIRHELHENKKWDIIHGHFRRICGLLSQFDEWAQCYVIDLFTEYARLFLPKPIGEVIDPDLELFLESMKPLVQSTSEAVILSIAKSVYLVGPSQLFQDFQLDLVLTRIATTFSDQETSVFALEIVRFISKQDAIFEPYYRNFYVLPTDSTDVAICKLQILSLLATPDNFKYIFEELKYYSIYSSDKPVGKESIKALGNCSQLSLEWSQKILKWCLAKIKKTRGETSNEILTVIRYLIQQKSETNNSSDIQEVLQTTFNLAGILDDESIELESDARASIIWVIGEYTALAGNSFAPDVSRKLLVNFADEEDEVRYQILVLASKIYAYELIKLKNEGGDQFTEYAQDKLNNSVAYKMFQHTLHLSKYDTSYDTRDRARMFSVLLSSIDRAQLASLFLQVPKPVPFTKTDIIDNKKSETINEFFNIIDWADPETLPPKSIRKEVAVEVNKLGRMAFTSSSSIDRTKSPSPVSEHAFSSQQFQNKQTQAPKPKQTYQLQSLDEFFGSEEYSSSSEEEEEESSSEEEEEASDNEENGEVQNAGNDNTDDDAEEEEYESSSDASSSKSLIR